MHDRRHHRPCVALASALLVAVLLPAPARADDEPLLQRTPAELRLGFERIKLPNDEHMGLVGLTYLLEPAYGWQIGPSVFGAATGQRGGFFVPGIETDWNTRLWGPLGLQIGAFVGGGGGGNAPVGSGLMLRPQATLWWDFKGYHVGLSASHVKFPDGQISSSQFGLTISSDTEFTYTGLGPRGESSTRGSGAEGLGFDRVLVVGGVYSPRDGSVGVSGAALKRRIGYAGARADRFFAPWGYVGIEAAGAASGGVAGYAEWLATLGFEVPVAGNTFTLGGRVAAGLAGGGDIPTGGGFFTKIAADAGLRLSRNLSLNLEGGVARAPRGGYTARFVSGSLRWDLQGNPFTPAGEAVRQEWTGGIETYRNAARRSGPARSLQNVVFKLNRYIVGDTLYLTGQAHSAYQGGAGAFSVGLLGAGVRWPLGNRFHVGAELLAGAAGGGGVATGGGAITQPMAYAGVAITPTLSAQIGAGRVRTIRGDGGLDSTVVDLTLNFSFGVANR